MDHKVPPDDVPAAASARQPDFPPPNSPPTATSTTTSEADWGAPEDPRPVGAFITVEEKRETTRKWIAYALVAILAGDLLAGVALLAFQKVIGTDGLGVKDFYSMTLPSITGLVGAVAGFYYGTARARP